MTRLGHQQVNADVVALLAFCLNWVGRPEEALTWLKKAMRFSPFYPSWFVGAKAHAFRLLGRFEEAVEAYRAAISNTPAYLPPRIGLTACYAEMGRKADAQESARKLLGVGHAFQSLLPSVVRQCKGSRTAPARAVRGGGGGVQGGHFQNPCSPAFAHWSHVGRLGQPLTHTGLSSKKS